MIWVSLNRPIHSGVAGMEEDMGAVMEEGMGAIMEEAEATEVSSTFIRL